MMYVKPADLIEDRSWWCWTAKKLVQVATKPKRNAGCGLEFKLGDQVGHGKLVAVLIRIDIH
jgi:hypothetical protein